jgi:hypothetical protein
MEYKIDINLLTKIVVNNTMKGVNLKNKAQKNANKMFEYS